ncbi:hypothetical protein GCM10027290_41470 [Micromonospora sonneratiae]
MARRWPGPASGIHRPVLGTAVTAAAIGAVSLPLTRPGVGWLVAVITGTAALVTAAAIGWSRGDVRPDGTGVPGQTKPDRARPIPDQTKPTPDQIKPTPDQTRSTPSHAGPAADRPRTRRSPVGVDQVAWAVATVALIGVGAVRAAGWLFVLCVLTAGVTACLAVTGGRSLRGMLLATMLPITAVFRAMPWTARGMSRTGPRSNGHSVGRLLATVAVSVGLLVVFGALFASADAAFADLLGGLLPELAVSDVVRWAFLFPVLLSGLLGAAYLLTAPPDLTGLEGRPASRVRLLEWALPVALLDLLFVAFVLVQITVLFGGAEHVLGESGPTYAQYARSGYWQLLVVSALTLLVIAGATRWAPRDTVADRVVLRLLLGALALLSLVVVASALYRMNVYTQAYGATRLRLMVAASELWLGLVFVLVLVAGIRLRATWLPRLVLGMGVLALLGLATINPDRYIAERNIDRFERTGQLDVGYLSWLSADAVPAFNRLPNRMRNCALGAIATDLRSEPDNWYEANLGRARARQIIAERPVDYDPAQCLTIYPR